MKIIAIVVFFLLGLLITFNETAVSTYVHFIKNHYSLPAAKQTDSLYQKISKEASKYEIKPQDATIDRVWKKIPGYNGLKVDISASYKKMKRGGKFDEKKLVFKQIQPSVHLKDLPHHQSTKVIPINLWLALSLMLHGEMNIYLKCSKRLKDTTFLPVFF